MAEEIKGAQGAEGADMEPGRTFTQSEVDALIERRLKRERENFPDGEELAEFRRWREKQPERQELIETLTSQRDRALSELEELRREKFLLGRGVPAEDADYYAYRIGRSMAEGQTFEAAAEALLSGGRGGRLRVETGAPLGGGRAPGVNETMNGLLRGTRPGGVL